MRRHVRTAKIRPPIAFIILPMIDVIFVLLLFFVMVTTFDAAEKVRVRIPEPEKSQARREDPSRRVVINCEMGAAGAPDGGIRYHMGGDAPEPLSGISSRLAAARAADPELSVVIRADRRLPFGPVRAAIEAVAEVGFEAVKVSVRRDLE